MSLSTKDVKQNAPLECRDAGTAQPPWTFQTATLCNLLEMGVLCGIAVVCPRKARFDKGAEGERESSLPFSREFGLYGSNPSSTLQCVREDCPLAIVRQLHGKADTETHCSIG